MKILSIVSAALVCTLGLASFNATAAEDDLKTVAANRCPSASAALLRSSAAAVTPHSQIGRAHV